MSYDDDLDDLYNKNLKLKQEIKAMRQDDGAVIADLQATVAELRAERSKLIMELMAARQHTEYLLATIRQAYDHVREEQSQASKKVTR